MVLPVRDPRSDETQSDLADMIVSGRMSRDGISDPGTALKTRGPAV